MEVSTFVAWAAHFSTVINVGFFGSTFFFLFLLLFTLISGKSHQSLDKKKIAEADGKNARFIEMLKQD